MLIRYFISLGLLCAVNLASAGNATSVTNGELACKILSNKLPKTLSKAKEIAPLTKEGIAPDLDYCHENLSLCDLRTLQFNGFSLDFLHKKATGHVNFHVAKFSSRAKLVEFCGASCAAGATYDKKAKQYVIDCQSTI